MRYRERSGPRLGLLTCAQLILTVDATIVVVALPTISRDLGIATANEQWIISLYALTFGGFLMIGGRAADLFGRRNMFATGLGIFVVMSVLCAVAQEQGLLIAGRAGQGLGAALASPAADAVPIWRFRDRWMPSRGTAKWKS